MDKKLLDEIIDCLSKDRTLFRYARNDYALMLLSFYVREGMRIADIKQTNFARLLEKPAIKYLMADIGDGFVTGDAFDYVYVEDRQNFLLTVGRWNGERSRYNQTSRNNENLVLQLNFSRSHDNEFERVVGVTNATRFEFGGHPILSEGERYYYRHTLAWVRMDIDFTTDEVLVEEIQTDWLRYAKHYLRCFVRCEECRSACERKEKNLRKLKDLKDYVGNILRPYISLWDEAALMAAIRFTIEELGIHTIYYHTFDTGNVLKGMWDSHPPRSLYTDLPRKFCFEQTDEAPKMFNMSTAAKRKLRKARNPRWFRLNMEARQ